jgi:hypothetical protein
MPGFLLHQGAAVLCMHGGQAQPGTPFPRVLLSKQPLATKTSAYTITACAFNVAGAPSPCLSALWTTTATRVLANKVPVLLQDSQAVCAPNGTGVGITTTQLRVRGI